MNDIAARRWGKCLYFNNWFAIPGIRQNYTARRIACSRSKP